MYFQENNSKLGNQQSSTLFQENCLAVLIFIKLNSFSTFLLHN
jgi:hypothetical protein